MAPNKKPSQPKGRTASKAFRRQQLIDSTIESIAKRGFAETTMADVADGAGLSRGIVNFHFKSKTMLLEETLRFLAEEYRATWQRALAQAGPAPIDRLRALVEVDFDPTVFSRKKVAVWYAFWGESKARPTYRTLCEAYDQEHLDTLIAVCREVVDHGDHHQVDAELLAIGIQAMSDGLWQGLLLSPGFFDRERCKETCYAYLAATFPNDFSITRSSAA